MCESGNVMKKKFCSSRAHLLRSTHRPSCLMRVFSELGVVLWSLPASVAPFRRSISCSVCSQEQECGSELNHSCVLS